MGCLGYRLDMDQALWILPGDLQFAIQKPIKRVSSRSIPGR